MTAYERELDDLTSLLIDHQLVDKGQRCLCGHSYRPGESIRRHRAQVIMAAGWRRREETNT